MNLNKSILGNALRCLEYINNAQANFYLSFQTSILLRDEVPPSNRQSVYVSAASFSTDFQSILEPTKTTTKNNTHFRFEHFLHIKQKKLLKMLDLV